MIDYKLQSENVDNSIRESTKFVYNTMRYHVVKYLGVFNIIYKFILSQEKGVPIDEVRGIDRPAQAWLSHRIGLYDRQ